MTTTKYKLSVHVPEPNGVINTKSTSTANYQTWLSRNQKLPSGTRVTVHLASGGTLQFFRNLAGTWDLERQTFA